MARKPILKIRKDFDLRELEIYGFKQITYYSSDIEFFKKVYLENDDDDRICYHIKEKDRIIRITRLDGEELDSTLYELINDGIVEVINFEH